MDDGPAGGWRGDQSQTGSAAGGFMRPEEVAADPGLATAEKRAILASWASDARAVPGVPVLRQLDNGAVVRVGDVLRALRSLDGGVRQDVRDDGRPPARLRGRVPRRLAAMLRRRRRDDDDDPPPCPAGVGRPAGQGPGGGAAVDAGMMLAA